MNRPIIEFRDVTFGYGATDTVLRDCSVSLERGSFVVLLGPSGCGKSTLLRLAAGFLRPRTGSVHFDGKEILAPDRRRILIFQEQDQLFPWSRLLANTALPLLWGPDRCSRSEAEDRARDALSQVGLAENLNDFPHQMSGGMKQRAVLARALAVGAEALLLDEPFASLDALSRESLQETLVSAWARHGSTVLFVTHDIREAVRIGGELWFLHNAGQSGQIERIKLPGGSPQGGALRDLDTPEAISVVKSIRERLTR
ncbi:MAG TPA: ATP-binding cassette domain-containing protein [bacterium]|nr:ATP-binding cassette domain-containing protein [bacterium]